MLNLNKILKFVSEQIGCDEVKENSDIENDLGCSADDFDDLINAYSKQFKVDMTSYLWYFHTDEEEHSNSIGRLFFKTPYEKVNRIPVTPKMLFEFAEKGTWDIRYPPHKLPKRRYDILINQILILLLITYAIYHWVIK